MPIPIDDYLSRRYCIQHRVGIGCSGNERMGHLIMLGHPRIQIYEYKITNTRQCLFRIIWLFEKEVVVFQSVGPFKYHSVLVKLDLDFSTNHPIYDQPSKVVFFMCALLSK